MMTKTAISLVRQSQKNKGNKRFLNLPPSLILHFNAKLTWLPCVSNICAGSASLLTFIFPLIMLLWGTDLLFSNTVNIYCSRLISYTDASFVGIDQDIFKKAAQFRKQLCLMYVTCSLTSNLHVHILDL